VVKIALIGAGSAVFSKNLTGDILSYPEFRDAHLACMDIDSVRLEVAEKVCRKIAHGLGANPTIEATTDRRHALAGADFVINMVQVGGHASTLVDFDIPRKYGLNFTIADTTGPGGLFRALRTYSVLEGICRDMAEVCPRAWLLNYANPMAMNMRAVASFGCERAVGLCHSVQGTINHLCWYLGIESREVAFLCAGINHMAFYLQLRHRGEDLYPRLRELGGRFDIYNDNKVRFELMKRLGYFVTESSEHNAEYCPYFIPHGPEMIERLGIPIDEYLRRCRQMGEEFEELKRRVDGDEAVEVNRTQEYAAPIMHAMVTGEPAAIYGNMPNHGSITNLPAEAVVEAPAMVDRNGVRLLAVGELPPQVLGYIQPHVVQQELFLRAVTERSRERVYQAGMFDPLTAATLTLDQIVQMCDELIAAHGALLPELKSL